MTKPCLNSDGCPSAPRGVGDILRQIGPGLIISANIVGAGELIVTTKLGAEVGFRLLWFILFGCLIKVVLQIELAAHCILRQQTTLRALDSLRGPRWIVSWVVWVWVLMFVATFFQVAGMVGGISDVLQVGGIGAGWPDWGWALLITISVAGLLAFGRYGFVERFATLLVAGFSFFTMIAVIGLAWTPYSIGADDLAAGLRFQLPDSFTTAFAAFGVIGMGASELIYYPYWCLEKGYGRQLGPDDGSSAWREQARAWLRVLNVDAWISMVLYTFSTVAFYLLGAAVLHADGIDVGNLDLIDNLSAMYRAAFGETGFWVFLLGAFAVLYSTVFIATASNGRLLADAVWLLGRRPAEQVVARETLARWAGVGLPGVYLVLYVTMGAPVTLVMVGAIAQALMLPFLALAALVFLHRSTAPELGPGPLGIGLLWLAAILVTAAGLYQIANRLGWW